MNDSIELFQILGIDISLGFLEINQMELSQRIINEQEIQTLEVAKFIHTPAESKES